MSDPRLNGYISYGPLANCTLSVCPIEASVYQYRPSLPANIIFLVIFSLLGLAHLIRGLRWRKERSFTLFMILGCISEVLGYVGRLLLWRNPFSFTGFMMQICLITFAPVFYCAAIYVLLSRVVRLLDVGLSRFAPRWWYAIFIPADLVSLVLQAAGGALSSTSSGSNSVGVDISVAGLSFQVVTLFVFSVACGDYAVRFKRTHGVKGLSKAFKIFAGFLAAAIVLIFIRCAYRIEELRLGYRSDLITNEGLFIALEGVMIVLAAAALLVAHPGPAFAGQEKVVEQVPVEKVLESSSDEEHGVRRT
ncbi:RTA1 like protein-domain-containing protein [Elsinoe ampelina]|uniref:RTA1 like protein-domain-containing protein n=1 Tax=Elsinoe ampelina TaxID=302913 RepID=A0A6A6GHK7_9PEZI|nr:RTA1 like protein-domain-containing protein [Elsinoe ampelina]